MAEEGGRLPWRHRVSLRLRITLLTALVVAIAVLMRRQWLWYVSVLAGAIGVYFLVHGLYM